MRASWVLAVALLLGAAPAAHASGVTSTPVSGLSAPTAIAAADFDGNGYGDLAITDGTDLVVALMPGARITRVPQDTAATAIAVGDLDHDGRADVATLSPTALTLNTRDADGDWHTTSLPATGTGVAIGDFNGDGWGDLAVRDTDVVRLFTRDPAGSGYSQSTEPVAGTGAIVAGSRDGLAPLTDLAVISGTDVAMLLGPDTGTGFTRRTIAMANYRRLNALALWGRTVLVATTTVSCGSRPRRTAGSRRSALASVRSAPWRPSINWTTSRRSGATSS